MRCRLLAMAALVAAPAVAHAAAGELDGSFGTGGIATGPEVRALQSSSLRVQDDGKIVVTGAGSPGAGSGGQFLVARFRGNGQLDTDYAFSGLGLLPAGINVQAGATLPAADNGLLSLAVTVEETEPGTFAFRQAVARFDAFGGGDSGFGTGGVVVSPGPSGGSDVAGAVDALYLPDGDVAGAASVYNLGSMAPRLAAVTFAPGTGTLNGYSELPSPAGGIDFAAGIVRTPDHKLVVAGSTRLVATPTFVHLARVDATTLALDMSFGVSGHVQDDFGLDRPALGGLAIQPDGKLVLAGEQRNPDGGYDVWVARLHADGALDPTFGSGGIQRLPTYNDDRPDVADVVRQPDGKLIVYGSVDNEPTGSEDRWFATRLTASGGIDESFGSNGFTSVPMANDHAPAVAGTLLGDGRLLIVGQRRQSSETDVITLVRLQGDPVRGGGPGGTGSLPSDGGVRPPGGGGGGGGGVGGSTTGAGPALTIRGGRVDRRGRARFRVGCPAGSGGCRGRMVVFSRPGTRAATADARRLGAARLRLPAGATKPVAVRLKRRVARSILRGTRVPGLVIATARDAARNARTTRANVTLRR